MALSVTAKELKTEDLPGVPDYRLRWSELQLTCPHATCPCRGLPQVCLRATPAFLEASWCLCRLQKRGACCLGEEHLWWDPKSMFCVTIVFQ